MNGTFGRMLNEMLVFLPHVINSDHAALLGELQNVLFDHNLDPECEEWASEEKQLQLLFDNLLAIREGIWVAGLVCMLSSRIVLLTCFH